MRLSQYHITYRPGLHMVFPAISASRPTVYNRLGLLCITYWPMIINAMHVSAAIEIEYWPTSANVISDLAGFP